MTKIHADNGYHSITGKEPINNTGMTSPAKTPSVFTTDSDTASDENKNLAEKIANQINNFSLNKNTIKLLEQINKDNVLDILNCYKNFSEYSLVIHIDNEFGLDIKTVREYVVAPLIEKAKEEGIDITGFETLNTINDINELESIINNFIKLFGLTSRTNKESERATAKMNEFQNNIAELTVNTEELNSKYEEINPSIEFSLQNIKQKYPNTKYNYNITQEDNTETVTITSKDKKQTIEIKKPDEYGLFRVETTEIKENVTSISEKKVYSEKGELISINNSEAKDENKNTDYYLFSNGKFVSRERNKNNILQRIEYSKGKVVSIDEQSSELYRHYYFTDGNFNSVSEYERSNPYNEIKYRLENDGSFVYENNGKKVHCKNNGNLLYEIGNGAEVSYWENGLIKSKTVNTEKGKETIYFSSNGETECTLINGKIISSPLAEKITKDINKKILGFIPTTGKDLESHIMNITPDNVTTILAAYYNINEESLYIAIENEFGLDKNLREKLINHIRECEYKKLELNLEYKKEISQISNEYYTGGSYSVNQTDTVLYIKNNTTGKESSIDIHELTKNMSSIHRTELLKYLQSLPGEVLEDIATETTYLKSDIHYNDGKVFKAAGFFFTFGDQIKFVTSARDKVFVHELGHAVDCDNGIIYNYFRTSHSKEFTDCYNEEMKKYLEEGNLQFMKDTFENDYKSTRRTVDGYYNYCTLDKQEMFAECYTLLMLGDCRSKNCILKYFPKSLNATKNLIQKIRCESDSNRH